MTSLLRFIVALALTLTSACAFTTSPSRALRRHAPVPPWSAAAPLPPAPPPTIGSLGGERWLPATAASSCAPVEIAPGQWITPLCRPMPAVAVRPFIRPFGFAANALPGHVDLRDRGLVTPAANQGPVGVCWAFALASVVESAARRRGHGLLTVAPLHVVANDAWHELWHGESRKPLTSEGQWAYDARKACAFEEDERDACEASLGVQPGSWRQSPQLRAELADANANGCVRFHGVEPLETSPANVDQLSSVLAAGHTIWASFRFRREAWTSSAVQDGVIDDYEALAGQPGHAVVLVGYRTTAAGKQFLIKNSWGRDWGHDGFAWMGEGVLQKHLYRALRLDASAMTSANARCEGSPSPTPPVRVTCARGQLRDLITGACATPCGGIFPPANGVCPFAAPSSNGVPTTCPNGFPPAFGICLPAILPMLSTTR